VSWAHIDIAGVAHFEKEHAGYAAGATGFGVALTVEFLKTWFGEKGVRSPLATSHSRSGKTGPGRRAPGRSVKT
jgi:hypothetical protein